MPEKLLARRFYISGLVQAVGYRFFVVRRAAALGLKGYTKNLRDGSVEVYAIGSSARLADFRAELERGPAAASVSGVREEEAEVEQRYASDFSIERDL